MLLKVDIEKVRIKKLRNKQIWVIEYEAKRGDERLNSYLWTYWKFDSAYSNFNMAEDRLKQLSNRKFTEITVDDYVLEINKNGE